MSNTDKYMTGPDDIVTAINDLTRRVDALERVPRLQSASIDSGGITVKAGSIRVEDTTGDIRLIMGLLPDTNYGFNVKENGQNTFHEVPFVYSDFIATQESTQSGSFVDLTTIGPTVTMSVGSSGRVLVFIGGTISVSPGVGTWGGFISLNITGANTIVPTSINGSLGYVFGSQTAGQNFVNSSSRLLVFTGLNPGVTTFQCKYAVNLGGPPETALFRNRALAVVRI